MASRTDPPMDGFPPPTDPPPTSGLASADAMRNVRGPARGIMIVGGLHIVGGLAAIVATLLGLGMGAGGFVAELLPEPWRPVANVIGALLAMAVGGVAIVGATQMMKLRGFETAFAVSILIMLPCTICCLVGVPVGAWSIATLLETKPAFT